jgi:O-antigen/teichoic acid export membrane protein
MNNRSFVRHAAVYGLANLLIQAGGFILVPLYARCLTRADFGVLEVLGRAAELIGGCLLIGGLRQALFTFHQQAQLERHRRRAVCAVLILVTTCCLLGGGAVLLFAGPISACCGQDLDPGLLRLAVLGILLEPLAQMPLALLQARVESVAFVSVAIGQLLVRVALTVLFVVGLGLGVAGVFGATALTGALFGVVLIWRELARGVAWPGWRRLRDVLAFTLPFLPGGLCFFVLNNGDRFLLLAWHGKEEVAIYSMGYKLASVVGAFTLVPLLMVWGSHMYTVARQTDAPRAFGRAFTRILAAYLFVALGLALLENEAVFVLGGPAYGAAVPIVAPVLLASFCLTAATVMDSAFYVRRRTGLKLCITLAATVVIAALYWLLIPSLGGMGGALATLGGFAFLAVGTYVVTQRIFPVVYEWGRVAAMLGLAVGLWVLARWLPATSWVTAARIGLWLLWPLLLWAGGAVSAEESQIVRSLLDHVLAYFRRPELVKQGQA